MSLEINKDAFSALSREASELYLLKDVPRLSSPPSPITFLRKYVMMNLPVVIENGISHWPALRKWNNQYLLQVLGDKDVTVAVTPNGYADATVGDKFVLPDEQIMKFKQFLTMLEKNEKDNAVVYIQKQNSSLLDEFEELVHDAGQDIDWASEAFGKLPDAVNFWMGSEHSVTSMHKDHYENMYAVVNGSKTFTLHPPTDLLCIPYKQYEVCRYKKNEHGEYVIMEEMNIEHCSNCEGESAASDLSNLAVNCENCHSISNQMNTLEDDVLYNRNNGDSGSWDTNGASNGILKGDHTRSTSQSKNKMETNEDVRESRNINGNIDTDYPSLQHCSSIGDNTKYCCPCSCHKPSSIPWIAVDPLAPDYSKYPLYRDVNKITVTLEAGDLLYLPSLWFHHVQQTSGTVAVNFWYDMEYDIKYNYFKFMENYVHTDMKEYHANLVDAVS